MFLLRLLKVSNILKVLFAFLPFYLLEGVGHSQVLTENTLVLSTNTVTRLIAEEYGKLYFNETALGSSATAQKNEIDSAISVSFLRRSGFQLSNNVILGFGIALTASKGGITYPNGL